MQLSEKADLVARGLFTKHAELQYVREKQRRDTEQSTDGSVWTQHGSNDSVGSETGLEPEL